MTRTHRRQILEIAVPVSIESSFQLFVGFVNQVIIASLGTIAIAAVGLANNLLFIGVLTLSALGSGTGILVSRARGRQDQPAILRLAWVGVLLALTLGSALAAPLVFWSSGFLTAIGTDPEVVTSASGYLSLVAGTLPFVAVSSVATMVFRSIGQVRLPMVVAMATGVLSPALSWVLVHFAGLAEPGAGIGLLIGQALKAVILVGYLTGRRYGTGFSVPTAATVRAESRAMVPLVMPLFVTEIVFSSGVFLYALLFGRIGTEALAVFQIVTTIEGVFIVGGLGFHSASTVLVARAVGGGVEEDVWFWARSIRRLAVQSALGLGLLYAAMIPLLGLLYPNTSDQVRSWTAIGILLNALFLPVKVSNILWFGTLASGGDTRYLLLSDVVTVGVVGLPLAYLLGVSFGFGLWGVFAARLLGEELSRLTMLGLRYRSGRWFDLSAAGLEPATSLPA